MMYKSDLYIRWKSGSSTTFSTAGSILKCYLASGISIGWLSKRDIDRSARLRRGPRRHQRNHFTKRRI
jgi:hypothetical protein